MKLLKITIFLASLLFIGCNADKIAQLEKENLNLKKTVDSLNLLTADMVVTKHKILGKWIALSKEGDKNPWKLEFTTLGKAYSNKKGAIGQNWFGERIKYIADGKSVLNYLVDGQKIVVSMNYGYGSDENLLFELIGDTLIYDNARFLKK